MSLRHGWVLALVSLGCTFDPSATATISCADAGPCPTGYRCQERTALCVRLDAPPPGATLVLAGRVSPQVAKEGTLITVAFSTSAPLVSLPTVVGRNRRGELLPFEVSVDGSALRATAVVPAGSPQGWVEVVISGGLDASGGAVSQTEQLGFDLDVIGPRPLPARLELRADPAAPVQRVTSLGPTVTGTVSFDFDDVPAGAVSLEASPPLVDITLAPTDAGHVEATLRARADAGVEATVTMFAHAVDAVGNQTDLEVPGARLIVDTRAPPAPNALLRRAPFGTETVLVPQLVVSTAAAVGTTVRVRTADGLNELGRGLSTDGGVVIERLDETPERVLVDAIDEAGNLSGATTPSRTELLLVPNTAARADQVPQVFAFNAEPTWVQRELGSIPVGRLAVAVDQQGVSALGGVSFRSLTSHSVPGFFDAPVEDEQSKRVLVGAYSETFWFDGTQYGRPSKLPVGTANPPTAHDRARDVFVRATLVDGEVEEFDGRAWRNVRAAFAPRPRLRARLASAPRGGVLLLGGVEPGTNRPMRDAWLYRDRAWTQLDAGQAPLDLVAATFDPDGQRTLFVGSNDGGGSATWAFDGDSFSRLLSTGPRLLGVDSMLTWNRAARTGYLVTDDYPTTVWTFVDGGWKGTGQPAVGVAYGVAYSAAAKGLLMGANDEEFFFDPVDGGLRALTVSPRPDTRTRMMWAAPEVGERSIIGGGTEGNAGSGWNDVWEFTTDGGYAQIANNLAFTSGWLVESGDGGYWLGSARPTFSNGGPGSRTENVYAWAPLVGPPVRIGAADAGPRSVNPPSLWREQGALMLHDPTVKRFDGTTWRVLGAHDAGARLGGIVLSTPQTKVVTVVGGSEVSTNLASDLSATSLRMTFDDAGLSSVVRVPTPGPLRRSDAAAGYDPVRQTHWLFGGRRAVGAELDDVLEVEQRDGGLTVTPWPTADAEGDGSPVPMYGAQLMYSPRLRGLVLVGGHNDSRDGNYYSASIDRDDTSVWLLERASNRPAVEVTLPVPRSLMGRVDVATLKWKVAASAEGQDDAGQPLTGARLFLWSNAAWVELDASQGEVQLPLSAIVSVGTVVRLRVDSRGANGTGQATVTLDALSVSLEYTP